MLNEGQEILEGRYKVIKRLGSGAFGEIFKVEKIRTGEFFAAKIEKASKHQKHVMLFWESKLIHKLRGKTSVPALYYVGTDTSIENKNFHVMVMDMLGPSLEDLFQACKRQFDLKTVLLVGIQMVKRIEKVHEDRIIHRDIKPDNFLIGGTDVTKDSVFVIDFGLAKCFKNSDGQHIPYREGKNLTGTARYASINTHKGIEQSRRDDLETIGHVLLYFLRGSLPWQGLPGRNKDDKYNNIKKKKMETSLDELCKGYPVEFKEYMEYCRELKFEDEPDYKKIYAIFDKCLERHKLDPKTLDFMWKQNRLSKDKEALKNSVLNVIKKKPKVAGEKDGGQADEDALQNADVMKQGMQTMGRRDDPPQGFSVPGQANIRPAQPHKEEMKTMIAMAGTGIVNGGQIPSAAQTKAQYYGPTGGGAAVVAGNYDSQQKQPATTGMGMTPQKFDSQNKRGSEFKKSAQHILNR